MKKFHGSKHESHEFHGGGMGAGELGGAHAGGRSMNRGPGMGRATSGRENEESPTRMTPMAEKGVKNRTRGQEEDNT